MFDHNADTFAVNQSQHIDTNTSYQLSSILQPQHLPGYIAVIKLTMYVLFIVRNNTIYSKSTTKGLKKKRLKVFQLPGQRSYIDWNTVVETFRELLINK